MHEVDRAVVALSDQAAHLLDEWEMPVVEAHAGHDRRFAGRARELQPPRRLPGRAVSRTGRGRRRRAPLR